MKLKTLLRPGVFAAAGVLACTLAVPLASNAATFLFNGVLTCNSIDGGMSMDPAGNLTITCTPATTTTTAGSPPACTSVSATASPITAGGSTSMVAVCSNSPTSYVWNATGTNPANGPSVVGANTTTNSLPLTFGTTAQGTYTYNVVATNGNGNSGTPVSGSVTVNAPAAQSSGSGGCNTTGQTYTVFDNSWISVTAARGSTETRILNGITAGLELHPIQSTSSPLNLTIQFSVSTCPGDFDNVPAACKTYGSVEQGAARLTIWTPAYQAYGNCIVQANTQYYLNMRNVDQFGNPSCPMGSCNFLFQRNGY